MKWFNYFFALYYAILLVLYICGVYKPDGFIIGLALFQSSMLFLTLELEAK